MPDTNAAAGDRSAGRQRVGSPAQRQQMRPRACKIGGFVEPYALAFEHLVGADHQRIGKTLRDLDGLKLSEGLGAVRSRRPSAFKATLTASSSACAGTMSTATPAAANRFARLLLAEARITRCHGTAIMS